MWELSMFSRIENEEAKSPSHLLGNGKEIIRVVILSTAKSKSL